MDESMQERSERTFPLLGGEALARLASAGASCTKTVTLDTSASILEIEPASSGCTADMFEEAVSGVDGVERGKT